MACRILYCHCAYARIVPVETKAAVLEGLAQSHVEFDAVPDLCQMAAQKDPRLHDLASGDGSLRIAACYPRAVKWLLSSACIDADRDGIQIFNMRTESPEQVLESLLKADEPAATDRPGARQ